MKVGDKVNVYGNVDRAKDDPMSEGTPIAYLRGSRGKVVSVLCGGEIQVKIEADESKYYKKAFTVSVHEKQCRRLKRKQSR
jgi:hypothetical protein